MNFVRFSYGDLLPAHSARRLLLGASPAIAQTKDHAPVGIKSSSKMAQDKAGSESWTYAQPREVFGKYRTLIVDNSAVYSGPDAQFDGIEAADRAKFAAIVTNRTPLRTGEIISQSRQACRPIRFA